MLWNAIPLPKLSTGKINVLPAQVSSLIETTLKFYYHSITNPYSTIIFYFYKKFGICIICVKIILRIFLY